MGFYIRKSARLGPLRINFSKSGIGVSAGIPGFRIGTGPRGAYIHAGKAGLYYRQSLGARKRPALDNLSELDRSPQPGRPSTPAVPPVNHTLGPEERIDSQLVLEMHNSTDAELIDELQACRSRVRLAPLGLGAAAFFLVAAWAYQAVIALVVGLLILPVTYLLSIKDIQRKGFVLRYELDADAEKAAADLIEAFEGMQKTARIWYLDTSRRVLDRKYHAGASAVVNRSVTRVVFNEPPYVRTNVPVPSVNLGKETLYFLPDRLLVYTVSTIGTVSYADLQIAASNTQFIEDAASAVPADAEVVDWTWRYVNKRGGPDRRFKDNPKLPIVLYEEVSFSSASGLRETLQLSRRGHGKALRDAILRLNGATANGRVLRSGGTPPVAAPAD